MARENQGLQIALIIFVMLTIVLGVTTFIFFRQYDEASVAEAKAKEDSAGNRKAANEFQDFNAQLKKFLGFKDTDDLPTIQEAFQEDMLTYAPTLPQEEQFYRPVLANLKKTLDEKDLLIKEKDAKIREQTDRNERRDSEVKPQIAQAEKVATKAKDDLLQEQSKFDQDRQTFQDKEGDLAKRLERARKDSEAELARVKGSLDEMGIKIQKLSLLNQQKSKQLAEVVKETFEVADGEVTWVNQRSGTVWVNLGRADGLGRQTSFSVYDADTNDVTKTGKKASLEVTQILGDHVAEARIVDDHVSDPIMPGDKVYTPVWTPGERRHFALVGFLDIDGDGKSDLDKVRDLIGVNGGIVDAWVDDNAIHGKMTINTRYLVKGEAPSTRGNNSEAIARWSKMLDEAQRLGIQEVGLGQLLNQMGWRNQTPVVTYGPGGNPNDFRALPHEGVNRTGTGNVSGLFKERQPPKASPSGGAF